MLEINKIYNEDCLEGMKKLPDDSVDCVICDLPYYKVVDAEFDNQWKTEEDYLSFIKDIIIQYKRVVKQNGNIFLFTSRQLNRKICNILDEFFIEKRIIIWARKRGFNSTRGKALSSGYEPICYYCNGENGTFNNLKVKVDSKRPEYNTGFLKDGINLSDVWTDISALPHNSKEKTEHPTQKPEKLIERIILLGTNENDIILDSCMGSGTTAICAMNTNRQFIGFEASTEYYNICQERINKTLAENDSALF